MHEFAAFPNIALNQTHVVDKSDAPAVSEYCKANVCVVPLPEAGDTASAVTVPLAAAGETANALKTINAMKMRASLAAAIPPAEANGVPWSRIVAERLTP